MLWLFRKMPYCPLLDVKLPECFLETQLQRERRIKLLELLELLDLQPQEPRTVPCTKLILSVCLWNKNIVGENAKHKINSSNDANKTPSFATPPAHRMANLKPLLRTDKHWTNFIANGPQSQWCSKVWGDALNTDKGNSCWECQGGKRQQDTNNSQSSNVLTRCLQLHKRECYMEVKESDSIRLADKAYSWLRNWEWEKKEREIIRESSQGKVSSRYIFYSSSCKEV